MGRILFAMLFVGFAASAEDKTCTVSGMHCSGCKEMVEGKICDETKYSTCEVKILDEEKEICQVRLVTKDAKAKVDEKALAAELKQVEPKYKLSCKGAPSKKG